MTGHRSEKRSRRLSLGELVWQQAELPDSCFMCHAFQLSFSQYGLGKALRCLTAHAQA